MTKKKIMIAEDNIDILDVMKIIFEDAGYGVITTINGKILLDMKKALPDLILLDIWMSDIDGTVICKKLKSQNKTKQIPIIICSANSETEKLSRECGATDFITKPFEIDELLAKVKNILGE